MQVKLEQYKRATRPLPSSFLLWPLYGAGIDKLGRNGEPVAVNMPQLGSDELLVRHDAVGLCFSDVKVIRAGSSHPRIYRDMRVDPVVLGHEVTLTVVRVGENLRDRYQEGQRFIVQADIYLDGVGYAYGYEIQGGLSQYSVIDDRVLDADDGNHLIPVNPAMGYAESALTEPWTCVNTAYRLEYRSGLKPHGITWIVGSRRGSGREYTISRGFDTESHPAELLLTNVPAAFESWLRTRASDLGVKVTDVPDISALISAEVDDAVLLEPDADLIEGVSPKLANFGVVAIVAQSPLSRKVDVDVGRVHYNRWLYVGGPGPDIAHAYGDVPIRSTLEPGGRVWFVGAGGPMGQMHVQRALQAADHPKVIFCTARTERRLRYVESVYASDAKARGVEFVCVSRQDEAAYHKTIERVGAQGFDDIIVMAPDAHAISESADFLAPGGVMNIFAGVARGTMSKIDLSDVFQRSVRFIGHSGLTTEDMQITLDLVEARRLSPGRLVAAVGSLRAAREGLQAVSDAVFPGKIVIFPHIRDLPLTVLPELKNTHPSVYSRLKDGREWTVEAEDEFLRLMLP